MPPVAVQSSVVGVERERVRVYVDRFTILSEVRATSAHPDERIDIFRGFSEHILGLGVSSEIYLEGSVWDLGRTQRVAQEGTCLGTSWHVEDREDGSRKLDLWRRRLTTTRERHQQTHEHVVSGSPHNHTSELSARARE